MTRVRLIRLEPGAYRHLPSGYKIVQYVRREGAWRVLDGGGHEKHSAPSFAAARKWIEESADA